MVRVYAIASAKGGVGKTTTTANLGATLAGTGADVVVIDGDIGMANLGAALGVRPHGATLHDALSEDVEPVAAAYEGPAGVTVVPGDTSLEAFSAADPQQLQGVVEAFDDADFVLIDVGAGVSHETSVPLSVADAVLLVSTAERDALVDTEKTRQLTDRLGGVVAGAVLTRTDEATPVEEITSSTLTADVLTTIPEDEAVRESIAVGEPLVSYAPHSDAAAAYRRLVIELTGIEPAAPPEPAPVDANAEPADADAEPADADLSPVDDPAALDSESPPVDDVPASEQSLEADRPTDDVAESGTEPDAESGVTIDTEPDSAADTPPTDQTPTASDSSDDSDDEHNVVNPFAANPEADFPPEPGASESKWAEAATGTNVDRGGIEVDPTVDRQPEADSAADDAATDDNSVSDTDSASNGIEIRPEGVDDEPEAPAESDGIEIQPAADDSADSVPQDAIPFGNDNAEEDSAQTTVLGDAVDDEPDDSVGESNVEADDAEEPLIPDAEETAAANTDAETEDTGDASDDTTDNEDSEEKRGFFSRLFR